MALAININDLLNKQKLESNRIEFKKGWNPGSIYHSRCAFAIPVHEVCGESSETDLLGSETQNESSEIKEIRSETTSKSSERNVDTMKDVYNCIDIKKRSGDSPLRLY